MKAILGGTFDPVHLGHLHAARRARAALGVPDVTLLLAARPGHRAAPRAGIRDRWRMLRLATRCDAGLLASDLEVVRPGPSYTVDSLGDLRGEPLVWLIGRDALADVPSWHRAGELASLCHFVVLDRPGVERVRAVRPPGIRKGRRLSVSRRNGRAVVFIACPTPCSTFPPAGIRRTIAEGGDASALLPCDVWTYIWEQGLYKSCGVEGRRDQP